MRTMLDLLFGNWNGIKIIVNQMCQINVRCLKSIRKPRWKPRLN